MYTTNVENDKCFDPRIKFQKMFVEASQNLNPKSSIPNNISNQCLTQNCYLNTTRDWRSEDQMSESTGPYRIRKADCSKILLINERWCSMKTDMILTFILVHSWKYIFLFCCYFAAYKIFWWEIFFWGW